MNTITQAKSICFLVFNEQTFVKIYTIYSSFSVIFIAYTRLVVVLPVNRKL